MSVHTWLSGDRSKAVPVAGMLADNPELHDRKLPVREWEKRLATYLTTPCP